MFSEYASKFLAQSQTRSTLSQADNSQSRNLLERQRGGPSTRTPSRGYLQRQPFGNPYQNFGTQSSRFPFASKFQATASQAPLFHSATDEFREEDDTEEHEREVEDFYALQSSRRDFGTKRLIDSSDSQPELLEQHPMPEHGSSAPVRSPRARGIRSSWFGETRGHEENQASSKSQNLDAIGAGSRLIKTRDHLVEVNLQSTIHEDQEEGADEGMEIKLPTSYDEGRRNSYNIEDAPSLQKLRPKAIRNVQPEHGGFLPGELQDPFQSNIHSPDSDEAQAPAHQSPRHDSFWSTLFLICLASICATFFLVVLHTSAPSDPLRLGDTIYSTIHSSFYLLAVDTMVAVILALVWLAALRSFVKPIVMLVLVAVPVICSAFALYPFISSFKGSWGGSSIQDTFMRWSALIPALFAVIWTYSAYKGRKSLGRAIDILEFSTRILAASPALIGVGFATLAFVVSWTWIWMLMFTRVFLGGHFGQSGVFIIDTGSWWLGAFFFLIYLWTLGVVSGLQRAITAATVSQWYFHRLASPAPSSQLVVRASFQHATTTIFGTICLFRLLALAVRVPLLVLPRRLGGVICAMFYNFVPTSIAVLTNPLTLTYAAIHSQSLATSARGLSEMSFISSTSPTTTLTPQVASQASRASAAAPPILAYRLAKLLLSATRYVAALAFGFGGWVSTARLLPEDGYRGSMYAYVVGLVAAAIGWAVLGAMEGVLGGILDAVVVCWGSEVGREGTGQARYCREAGELFGDAGAINV